MSAPRISLFALVQLTGLFWLVGGILRIVGFFLGQARVGRLLAGILGVVAGLLVLRHPLWSTVLVPGLYVFVLGAVGVVFGVLSLVTALTEGGRGAGVLGALSLILGVVLLLNPLLVGVGALPYVLGVVSLAGGISAVAVAFRMRKDPVGSGAVRGR